VESPVLPQRVRSYLRRPRSRLSTQAQPSLCGPGPRWGGFATQPHRSAGPSGPPTVQPGIERAERTLDHWRQPPGPR